MIIITSSPTKWKIGAEIIKWYQGTNYSHVALIDNDDLVYQASHGYVNVWNFDVFMESNDVISVYEIPDEAVDMDYIKSHLGRKYGFDQILRIAFYVLTRIKLKSNGEKRFICSELIGKALRLSWVDDYTTPEQIDEYLRSVARRV